METFNLLSNPDDILKRIVDFLPLQDAINFYSTNKRLRSFLFSGNRFQIILYCEQESISKRKEFLPGKLPDHFRNHPQLLSNVQKFVYAIDKKERNIDYLKELFTMLPNVKHVVAAALESECK
jgi:hypothetical protein